MKKGESIVSTSLLFTEKEKIHLKKSPINVKCNAVLLRGQSCFNLQLLQS